MKLHVAWWGIHVPPSGDVRDGWPMLVLAPCPAVPLEPGPVAFVKHPPDDGSLAVALTCPACGDLVAVPRSPFDS